jgi:hypothetical protein
MNLLIHGYQLTLTCAACPEQYDVHDNEGNQVAHMRLKNGVFSVHCPDYGDEIVYTARPRGESIFNDSERLSHLNVGIINMQEWLIRERYKLIHGDDDES